MKAIDLIPVPSDLGGPDAGTSRGPEALRRAGLLTTLESCGLTANWIPAVEPSPLIDHSDTTRRWQALTDLCQRLSHQVAHSLQRNHKPLVIGGDHAIAVGTWRGLAAALPDDDIPAPFGLLWLDAHLDAHTPEDSASANPHGMPVAMLLGDGSPVLAHPVLSPAHTCLVGARSWELPEKVRLQRHGVTVFDQRDIQQRGLETVLKEAIAIVSTGTRGFGLSIDLDVFDPGEAPAVNCPVPGGTAANQWVPLLQGIARRDDCLAVELIECNGLLDTNGPASGQTTALACQLVASLFSPQPMMNESSLELYRAACA